MRALPIVLLILSLGVTPLVAQGRGGFGGGGGRDGMGGRPMMARRPEEPPSEDLVRGPYPPDSLIPKFGLDSAQGGRYRVSWDSMMAATAPTRDSVRMLFDQRRRARAEGFQRIGTADDGALQKLGKALKKEEARFDKVMKRILTKDQWGDFKDWRDRRRATERELREEQRMNGPMGGSGRGRPRD